MSGLRIAYERAGDGPPLVLLHGYVGDARGTWGRQIDDLSDEFTVVAWEAPGMGRSSDPPESFRLPDYADCLAGFVAALGLERPHVAGLSFGGGLALELYRRHPDDPGLARARRRVCGVGRVPSPEVVEERLRQVLQLSDLPPDRFVRAVLPTMFSTSVSEQTLDEFAANVSAFHPAGLRAMARSFAEADLRDVLPRIDVPTLLLYGDQDMRAPMSVAEDLHAAIPSSRLVVLPGVGHVSSVEAGERFTAEVRMFLRYAFGRLRCIGPRWSVHRPIEAPSVGDALQLVFAGVLEREAGAGDRSFTVEDTSTSEGPAFAADAGADVHADAPRRRRPRTRPPRCAGPPGSRRPSGSASAIASAQRTPGPGRRRWRGSRRPSSSPHVPRSGSRSLATSRSWSLEQPRHARRRSPPPSRSSPRCR